MIPHYKTIDIEIKQNKEYMEEKEWETESVPQYPRGKRHKVGEHAKLNLKPFDLQKAKEGKPVCTRDGRKARIICFDRNDLYPIVALIECEDGKEIIGAYSKEGQTEISEIKGTNLMMLPEKKEGWVNVYQSGSSFITSKSIFNSKEGAIKFKEDVREGEYYLDTIKIIWEV